MARKCLPLPLALCLLLAACGPRQEAPQDDGTLDLVATTYPVYLFAAEVTRGAEDVTLTLMIDQPISCLHDYTLTVKDMKALERADGILLNGAGLEEAMEDALASVSDTPRSTAPKTSPCWRGQRATTTTRRASSPPATSTRPTPTSGWTPTGPAR